MQDLHVKHQTDNFGSWKCKYDSQNEQIVPVSPSHNNFVANFTRKISLSLKGPDSAISPAGTLVNVQKALTPQTVKFKMEVRTSSEQSGGCRIIFIHQQGSYSLLQSTVEKFKSAWPLGQISKKEGV
ncbi:hypothetical protein BCR33DRAFT_723253 [Rhizoclosmatium globosum]|uniref:Uncharacterized protein n=1 Tax=Rhizoclosmatium globosum TaxID=329046 RepID=A0A1Y2BEL3_9FUNG|nr:hypothetical protein BCR33DRAFT_723253 [Rhizoclosmatium globosum]|eukprot:ORY33279.1 hypothetical protein BCR33DRAFT_723253 [Rhizoclosmatium globosum]